MDYSSQHGLSSFTGRKMMIFLCLLFLSSYAKSTVVLGEGENVSGNQSATEVVKSEVTKREEPEAQRREHSFNSDGTVNYHGSGSGHDSGDLVPPPGGSVFNSPSIELSVGHTGASGPGLSNSYGLPIPDDTYGPPKSFFNDKPSSFYGPPSQQYGPPRSKYLPPPKPVYGPPKLSYSPSLPPKPVYGTPALSQFRPPKSTYAPLKSTRPKPSFSSRPKPVYGPPSKEAFGTGFSHGTLLSPVTNIKTQYGPPKFSATYGTPLQPSTSYGVPKHTKHGHVNAPPTPPIVKYDGWKPIPGLISNAPSNIYGAPNSANHPISTGPGSDFSSPGDIAGSSFDSIVPPSASFGGTSFGSSGFGIQLQPTGSYGPPAKPSASYGTPLQPSSSYGHRGNKGSSKLNFLSSLKVPGSSFGFPDSSLTSRPSKPSHSYGPPKPPSISYGAPQISSSYGPPKAPSSSFGPTSISFGSIAPPTAISSSFTPPKIPSIAYGPPKAPSSSYGPPKAPSSSYGPPKAPSSLYKPPKPSSGSYGPPKPPSVSYGPPKAPSSSYGPPKPPSSSYGPPKAPSSSYGPPQIFTTYSIPKPGVSISATPNTAYRGPSIPHPLQPPSTYGPPSFQEGLYKAPLPPNALYGVPLAPAPPTAVSCCGPFSTDSSWQFPSNTYGTPASDLHAPLVQNVPSVELNSQFFSTGPSPIFSNAIPSTSYGTPLLSSTPASLHAPANTYGVPTALPLRQPKNPVKFRPPVPAGLISSIGAKWGDSAAWGGNAQSHKFHGNTYIPPAVPDPDPGIRANKGNPLVIPPPPAPPINYGLPSTNHEIHNQVSNQFASTAASHSSAEGSLYPPPPPPPSPLHGQNAFDIQQSASVELPSSNNLDHPIHDNKNQFSAGSASNYNALGDTATHHHSTGTSGAQDFASGVQNIPVKGNQGSYTLQIQAAGGNSGEHVPHNEVLSDGLLQDILAAIENPSASEKLEQYGAQQSSDPVASEIGLNILKQLGGTHAQQSTGLQLPTQYGSDLTHASSSNVPLYAKSSGTGNEIVQIPSTRLSNITEDVPEVKIGKYLSQNKIAFYYNNEEGLEERKGDGKDILLVQMLLPNNSTSSESEKRPVRANRLETSTVRATPYPQPAAYNQTQAVAPDSTVQETEPVATADCQLQSSKSSEQPVIPTDHCHPFVQGKIGTPNVGHSCIQNSTTAPYNTTATIPVIQPSCVLPVEQCIGNGVLTNISSNGNCIPASPCFTTVIPANIVGTNSNACLPAVTPRFQTPVVDSSVAITDCRCQAEGSSCCHSAIASYPSAHAPTSMIFVPYSIPNFPPQPRGNLASNTSPCGGATPVKDTKGSRATSPRAQSKPDTSQHYHIFVGDLSPEIDTQTLRDAFAPFGEISDSRVVRDAQTLKSKGYGFVSFMKKSEAKSAIAAMNGRWLGSRSIRTNWATRKPPLLKVDGNPLPLSFDEVYKQSSASNCTVYCGGIINGLTEELVQKIFSPFGTIQEIKMFKEKGYAFVRFSTKESAAHAIVAVHNTEVNGQVVKCSWGKENSDLTNIQAAAQFDQPIAGTTFPYAYGQQMGYWYPQSFPATTTQIPGQYLQSGFSLGQFGYHQDFIGRLSMNLSSIWNGMPGQTQLSTAMQPIGQGTAIQQPNSMVAAYPVQRFQLPEEEWTAPSLLV